MSVHLSGCALHHALHWKTFAGSVSYVCASVSLCIAPYTLSVGVTNRDGMRNGVIDGVTNLLELRLNNLSYSSLVEDVPEK